MALPTDCTGNTVAKTICISIVKHEGNSSASEGQGVALHYQAPVVIPQWFNSTSVGGASFATDQGGIISIGKIQVHGE